MEDWCYRVRIPHLILLSNANLHPFFNITPCTPTIPYTRTNVDSVALLRPDFWLILENGLFGCWGTSGPERAGPVIRVTVFIVSFDHARPCATRRIINKGEIAYEVRFLSYTRHEFDHWSTHTCTCASTCIMTCWIILSNAYEIIKINPVTEYSAADSTSMATMPV